MIWKLNKAHLSLVGDFIKIKIKIGSGSRKMSQLPTKTE